MSFRAGARNPSITGKATRTRIPGHKLKVFQGLQGPESPDSPEIKISGDRASPMNKIDCRAGRPVEPLHFPAGTRPKGWPAAPVSSEN
ncbi:MAG: hypothetical protein OP8BY_2430 [Candidatus Saccharicenans subterraneus]|uniref:Uncharacterized protein n=1 Tax=Candidatus Saccharicenans subterraneus TaxID=2508984 RepID=A0A3E2BJ53_9BACT|nr:MAG: hypothetical protein OP8BY_2430 [Candidatus Saccharicenans subterraneum]